MAGASRAAKLIRWAVLASLALLAAVFGLLRVVANGLDDTQEPDEPVRFLSETSHDGVVTSTISRREPDLIKDAFQQEVDYPQCLGQCKVIFRYEGETEPIAHGEYFVTREPTATAEVGVWGVGLKIVADPRCP